MPLRFLSFLVFLLLLSTGCSTRYFLVRAEDLQAVEARLEAQEQRFERLWAEQAAMYEALLSKQQGFAEAVSAEIRARVQPPTCPAMPERVCPLENQQAEIMPVAGKQLVGAIETVRIAPPDLLIDARIDTGATTSSIDARKVTEFERDGRKWIRFTLIDPKGKEHTVERKLIRYVRVLQSIAEQAERRPVVELRVALGGIHHKAEFTLTDRSHLDFPVLIGRNILRDLMIVDVGRSYLVLPIDFPAVPMLQEVDGE